MEYYETEIDELDRLLGGGFGRHSGTLIRYDSNSIETASRLLLNLGMGVLDNLISVVLLPAEEFGPDEMEMYLDRLNVSLTSVLENDQLFVMVTTDDWPDHRNILHITDTDGYKDEIAAFQERTKGRGTAHIIDVYNLQSVVGIEGCRLIRQWYDTEGLRDRRDFLIDLLRVEDVPADLNEIYAAADTQALSVVTSSDETVIRVDAGPDTNPGVEKQVRFADDPPFLDFS